MINEMANIRPRYTKYEISKLVNQKFQDSKLSLSRFCEKFDIEEKTLTSILLAKRSFNKMMLSKCAVILEKDVDELLAEDIDALPAFRSKEQKEDTIITYNIANELFNEIIMQKKIFG